MATCEVAIPEAANKVGTAQAQRSGAIQDEPAYWIFVFSERPKIVAEPIGPPSGCCPGRGHIGARIRRFSRLRGGDKLTIKSRRGSDNSPSPQTPYNRRCGIEPWE